MEETEEQISTELETLETIFINELEIFEKDEKYVKTIKVDLKPATGENADSQWVKMELWLYIPVGYPDVMPTIAIRNPRGLSEQRISEIEEDLHRRAKENEGMLVLYELIQASVDHLTAKNIPDCQCSICLYDFVETDVFVKTGCFHYFHGHCLSRYIKFQLEEIQEKKDEAKKNNSPLKEPLLVVCPMCRVEIPDDLVPRESESLPPPSRQTEEPEFQMSAQLEKLQKQMSSLYLRQKQRGGIIDVEGEKNKFFIQISSHQDDAQGTQATPQLTAAPPASAQQQQQEAKAPQPSNNLKAKGQQGRGAKMSQDEELSDSDSDDVKSNGVSGCGRARNRRGKNKMYPTPSEKKRAHMQALQLMKQEQQKQLTQPSEFEKQAISESGSKGRNKNSRKAS